MSGKMMEKRVCELCSQILSNKFEVVDQIIKEMLDVLLLKMDLDGSEHNAICKDCAEISQKCFFFKSVCMETEEIILSHITDKSDGRFNLDDIYEGNKDVTEDLCVCRLCLNLEANCIFVPLDIFVKDIENMAGLLAICLPEIDLGIVANPVICESCRKNLCCYLTFVEKSRRTSLLLRPAETPDVLIISEPQQHILTGKVVSETKLTNLKKISKMKLFECATCNFKTKYKDSLMNHMKIHRDFSEEEMYKCASCSFKTKHRVSLVNHQIVHRNFSEEEMYNCASCSFKTKYKKSLACHKRIHSDFSKEEMYKCASCSFKTKHRVSLVHHKRIHRDFSEEKVYKCASCSFRTKLKTNLMRHKKIHSNFSEMYKCASCSFKSYYKESLVNHMKIHRDFSEEEMYKCKLCTFKTIHKGNLARHGLTHNKCSEEENNSGSRT